jgi:hypothetical protein
MLAETERVGANPVVAGSEMRAFAKRYAQMHAARHRAHRARINREFAPNTTTCRREFSTAVRPKLDSHRRISMPVKRIVVLANSIKIGHRCVAGREISSSVEVGSWIRPVRPTDQHNGALNWRDLRLTDGNFAAVGDIVAIPLLHQTHDPGQPENWLLDHSQPWSKVDVFPPANYPSLAEAMPDLWDDGFRSDAISACAQARMVPQRSLVMIRPVGFRVAVYREQKPWNQYPRKKTQARFEYGGGHYDLNITDDLIRGLHGEHPPLDAPEVESIPPFGDNCLLCVSLTPPLSGSHYKVVATILPLP